MTPTTPKSDRALLLVAGSGRSGTSLFAGILQRLGFRVPAPEVPADESNPRGFAESQWVVDFHTRLLRRAATQVADARPAAWALTADVGLEEAVRRDLREWLSPQYERDRHLVVKDPRLSWFLPLWRRCACDLGVTPQFVTMLRHPAAVVGSKQRHYGSRQGEAGRTAGWLNQTLFTERATREAPRAFIRYDDLLEDWTRTTARLDEVLDVGPVRDADAKALRAVHEFVDHGLSRTSPEWGDMVIPAPLKALADEVWEHLCSLAAEPGRQQPATLGRLDAARARYRELYADAEAVAHSSISAARVSTRAAATPPVGLVLRLARHVPEHHRRRMPLRWRSRLARI